MNSLTSSPTHRFFAVAGLKEPQSFDSVHEVICTTFVSEHDSNYVIFDGKKRIISQENHTITDAYYRNIKNRLIEVDQTQEEIIRGKQSTDIHISRLVNTLGRPQGSVGLTKESKVMKEERVAKKALIEKKLKLKQVTGKMTKVMKYFFADETQSDEVVWKPLQSVTQSRSPIRVVVYITNMDLFHDELEAYSAMLEEFSSTSLSSTSSILLDVELLVGSLQGSVEFLDLIARLAFPTRYFPPFDVALAASKDQAWLKDQQPYQTLLVRYFASFDYVVLPRWTENSTYLHFNLVWKTIVHRLEVLQQVDNPVVSSIISLPALLEVTLSSRPFLAFNRHVEGNLQAMSIKSIKPHILNQRRLTPSRINTQRMRALPSAKLVGQTVLMPLTTLVFGPGSLYIRPWIEQLIKQHLPSHSQHIQTRVYQLVQDSASTTHGYVLAKLVVAKNEDGSSRQELHHLSSEDEYLLRNHPFSARVLFISTFLDCAEPVDDRTQRLFMNFPSSFTCLNRLYHTLLPYFGETAVQSVRSMWFSGEAIVTPTSLTDAAAILLETFEKELPWLQMVFLPQIIPPRWSNVESQFRVLYLPPFTTSFPEFIASDVSSEIAENLNLLNDSVLLRPSRLLHPVSQSPEKRKMSIEKLIAYLYFRCDRNDRERLFRSLYHAFKAPEKLSLNGIPSPWQSGKNLAGIHALGACHGNIEPVPRPLVDKLLPSVNGFSSSESLTRDIYARSRFKDGYNLDAVRSYRNYSFVIAGENLSLGGYVTEKLTNAILAESIAIYVGNRLVEKYFNSSSFVACYIDNDSLSDRDVDICVRKVLEIVENPRQWQDMLSVTPITGANMLDRANRWLELFYWHEDARDTNVAIEFTNMLRKVLFG